CQAALGLHTIHQAGMIHGHLHAELFLLTGDGVLKLCGLGEPPWLMTPPDWEARAADAAAEVADLGRIAATLSALAARRKVARSLPEPLQIILDRLSAQDVGQRFATAAALLEALDQAGASVPPNAEAWERLLRYVRDHLAEDSNLRQSA